MEVFEVFSKYVLTRNLGLFDINDHKQNVLWFHRIIVIRHTMLSMRNNSKYFSRNVRVNAFRALGTICCVLEGIMELQECGGVELLARTLANVNLINDNAKSSVRKIKLTLNKVSNWNYKLLWLLFFLNGCKKTNI